MHELSLIASRLDRVKRLLAPMRADGGTLTALEARRTVLAIDQPMVELRDCAWRVCEMLDLISAHFDDILSPAPRPALRVVQADHFAGIGKMVQPRSVRPPMHSTTDDGPGAA